MPSWAASSQKATKSCPWSESTEYCFALHLEINKRNNLSGEKQQFKNKRKIKGTLNQRQFLRENKGGYPPPPLDYSLTCEGRET